MSPGSRTAGIVAGLVAVLAGAAASAATTPGRLVMLDAFADPFGLGHFGALIEADPATPAAAAAPLSSSADFYQVADLAFLADGSIVVTDRDADPSGFGADPNGDHGPGALFIAAASDQALSVLADGADFPAGLPPPARTVFVDPRGVAVAPDGSVLVADADADPSGLGPDTAGFAGHGALLAVSASGTVTLVSDGTQSDDGAPPMGAASWFQDPGAVVVASDGSVYVLDIFGDPLSVGGRGAVFRVDRATGRVKLVAVSAGFVAPTGLGEAAPGRLVVSDQLADLRGDGSRGALFAVDLAQPDPALAVTVMATDARFRGPSGLAVAADGSVFVADPFADPLGLGRLGGAFRLRPDGSVAVASSAPDYRAPVSVRPVPPLDPPPTLDGVAPPAAAAGDALTVALTGAGLAGPAEIRAGAGIAVSAVRVLGPGSAEADLVVDAAAVPGPRDVAFVRPDLATAVLLGGLTVQPRARPDVLSCAPGAAIQGTAGHVVVTGDRFADGASLSLGPGVAISSLVRADATRLEADIAVDAAAPPGVRDVVVTNPDGTTGALAGGFTVLEPAPPAPVSVSPAVLAPGRDADLTVDGSGFAPGMTLDLGAGITAGPVTVASPFRAMVQVHVAASAAAGPRLLHAVNPDLRAGDLADAVTVADAPPVRFVAVAADDAAGNRSGRADPGETVGLDVLAWNDGARDLTGAVIRVSSPPGSGLVVLRDAVTLSPAAPGLLRRAGPPLPEVLVDAAVPCGAGLPLHVEILEGATTLMSADVLLPVGGPASLGRKPVLDGDTVAGLRGDAVALADLDGDGSADLVAGAPRETPASVFSAGRVACVSGSTDDPLWTLEGLEPNGRLGAALASAGDVNGDGADDLLVGAPGEAAGAGRVRLLSGADGSVLGAITGSPGDGLGSAVALLGDRDLDGRPEALLGAAAAAGGRGYALIASLPELVERERLPGQAGDALGAAVAGLGDWDGDGRADAAVGAPDGARILVWRADGSTVVLAGTTSSERFGASLAGGRDADLDGIPDLIVGAPDADAGPLAGAGRVELVSGRDLGRRVVLGGAADARAGTAVAFAADLDGDGSADVAIGAPGSNGGDGLVELRSGADLRLLLAEPGAAALRGELGAALAGPALAGGDAFDDLAAGAPRHPVPGVPQAGRAMLLKTVASCRPVFTCAPDALEPNPSGAPSVAGYGTVTDLTICRDDVDAFRFDLAPGRRAYAVVRFRHADGDLDATLQDAAGGPVVDQSLSLDDDEEIGPFGPGGSWELRVSGFDGATNAYALDVVDPDSCPPASEVSGLRVRKAAAGAMVLAWLPSADACHAPAPGPSYRVWEAPSAAPQGPPGAFPAGSAFVDATAADLDGDPSNEAHVTAHPGTLFWLVADVGRGGEDGPAGWQPGP